MTVLLNSIFEQISITDKTRPSPWYQPRFKVSDTAEAGVAGLLKCRSKRLYNS